MTLKAGQRDNWLLLEFSYGPSFATKARYTNASDDVTFDGDTYSSVTTLTVRFPEQGGGLEQDVLTLELPVDSFVGRLGDGLPHSPVRLVIRQQFLPLANDPDHSSDPVETHVVYRGRFKQSSKNINGRSGHVEMEFQDVKGFMVLPMGLGIGKKCSFPFESEPCSVVIPDGYIQTVNLDTIRGQTVTTVPILNNPSGDPGFHIYHRGYVEKDGLRIGIKKQRSGTDTIVLWRHPPADWLGADVVFHPGCAHQREDCIRWNNEEHFGGFGAAATNYNPNVRGGV